MEIHQPPYGNHKGGQLAFGSDSYLYIGVGEGGSAAFRMETGKTGSGSLVKFCA